MSTSKPQGNKPYLITRSLQPENQETPIHFLESDIVKNDLFYRRNHFPYPPLSYSNYWLPINGSVSESLLFTMQDLLQFPSKTIKIVLECAGNKRNRFEPKVFGEQWTNGAISQGIWKGVPLRFLLERARVNQEAKEVVVEGYDFGTRKDSNKVFSYARSLPIEKALHPDTIIAYEYNHQPISFKHGYPLRLIVPEWYAMASVKWIKQIIVIDGVFNGPFQSIDYVYYPYKESNKEAWPVTNMNVNSTIQKPLDMEILNLGKHNIKGIAWTGKGSITMVEVSIDSGQTWSNVKLNSSEGFGYEWVPWTFEWNVREKGEYTIISRATDSYGRTQPSFPNWNRKGYGFNALDKIKVKVE